MSEHILTHEQPSAPETPRETAEHHEAPPVANHEQIRADSLETIRASIEQSAQKSEQVVTPLYEDKQPRSTYVDTSLRSHALNRSLQHIRHRLPPAQRAFSHLVHQPAVKVVSEASAKTVTRPSGLLGGGIAALIGSLLYTYFTRHIGLPYNYLLFVLFFVGGFMLGIICELLGWAVRRVKQ